MANSPGTIEPIFISAKDAATALGITTWSVYQLLNAQVIKSQYHGRRRLVRVDSLREYANSLPAERPDESA